MNLKNKKVTHDRFGSGIVVDYTSDYVVINFSTGEKKFIFPDAFDKFLKLNDKRTSAVMEDILEEKEKEREIEEIKLRKIRAIEEEKHRLQLKRRKILKTTKIHPSSQVVFKYKPDEQDEIFNEWKVFTGIQKSGAREGQPKRPARLTPNSACLLTAKNPNASEKDRYIIGAFMVKEDFVGKLCNDGYITAHPEHRIRLSDQESKKMLFWDYYFNERYPQNITWNSGQYRYFDNMFMAQILKDIVSMKQDSPDKKVADDFFKYYCQMNNISEEDIEEPNGSLKRA